MRAQDSDQPLPDAPMQAGARTVAELARDESSAVVEAREREHWRAMVLAEAQLERRKHLLELLTRERRVVRTEIADREDAYQREMRKLNARLANLNQEIKELRLPPGLESR